MLTKIVIKCNECTQTTCVLLSYDTFTMCMWCGVQWMWIVN